MPQSQTPTEPPKENAETYRLRALLRREQYRWSEALADAQHARELAPDDPAVKQTADLLARIEGQLAQIRELDARIALTPEDEQAMSDRALLFLRSEDPELALRDSTAASKLAPWTVRPKLFEAIALEKLGRATEAEQLGVTPHLKVEMLTPEFLETIRRLDSEVSLERNNADLLVARAWQLNDIGQPALALQDAQAALEISPNSAGAHAEAAYALAKLGRAEESYTEIQHATELDAKYATAWVYRGELEMARNDFAAAIDSFTHALAIAPNRAALEKREQAYRKLGQTEKASDDAKALEQ